MVGQIIVSVISVLFVLIGIGCLTEGRNRTLYAKETKNTVHLSNVLLWVGLICGGLFLVIAWFAALDEEAELLLVLCFAAFALFGMSLMLGWKNCYIIYDHKGFTQRNILGMQRSFTYDQLTGFRFAGGVNTDIKLYACGKTITVDWMSANSIDFLQEARKGYARCNNGTVLPNTWESQRKVQKENGKGSFSAHVHNPGEFLAIFIMLIVFFVGMGIFCGFMVWEPVNQSECQQMTICFSGWKIEDSSLILLSDAHEEPFEISGYEKHLHSLEEVTEKCDGRTQFDVWVKHYDPDDGDPYYNIYQMSAGGVTYRTFADSTNAKREQLPIVLYAFGGMLVLFLGFSWLTYKIGCNPRKYPKWLVYGFFKKDAISF